MVVEWRALTLALLDRTAERVRRIVGLSADELPLAKVLEGGTWRAGRELAAEKRAGGGPPLRVAQRWYGLLKWAPSESHRDRPPAGLAQADASASRRSGARTRFELLAEISILLAYEVTRDLPLVYETIETPFATMRAPVIEGKKIVLINILRAGTGMTEGMLQILPSARVGHIGVYRDPKTLGAVEYYFKMPREMADRDVIVVDPMLATGNSAIAAVDR